jgi:hypothetical protein
VCCSGSSFWATSKLWVGASPTEDVLAFVAEDLMLGRCIGLWERPCAHVDRAVNRYRGRNPRHGCLKASRSLGCCGVAGSLVPVVREEVESRWHRERHEP